jgi:hypothetical protein
VGRAAQDLDAVGDPVIDALLNGDGDDRLGCSRLGSHQSDSSP